MTNETIHYIDHHVINQDEQTIGTVTDVLYDDVTNEPKWLVVKPGMLQAERYVPIESSYTTDNGDVVVPFDKKWIKSAPKAGDHILTADVEVEAKRHYDVTAP